MINRHLSQHRFGRWFVACLLGLLAPMGSAIAQDGALTVTLPSGKTVTFQTPEQKERFEAALARRAASSGNAPAATPAGPAVPAAVSSGSGSHLGSSLSQPASTVAGVVNPDAPAFTAAYYMGAPETWIGKKVALSVGYVTSLTDGGNQEGYRMFSASTWNHAANTALGDRDGGQITVFVKAENALKLMQQCGTSFRWGSAGWARTSIIHGEFRRLPEDAKKEVERTYGSVKGYCLYVE